MEGREERIGVEDKARVFTFCNKTKTILLCYRQRVNAVFTLTLTSAAVIMLVFEQGSGITGWP